jgi:hypothetical protein
VNIDLSALTLVQVFGLLAVVTVIDVVGAMVLALIHRTFDLAYVAVWIESHTLKRAFPIFSLAVLGNGIAQLGIPPIGPAYAMALAALAAYVLETVASLRDSFSDTPALPTDTSPVPPAG